MEFNIMVLLPGEDEKMESDPTYIGKERIFGTIEADSERAAFAKLRKMRRGPDQGALRSAELVEVLANSNGG